MKFGSLFTGVGGFDLGLERISFECAWQVEKDRFCLQVLEEHYPDVKRYTDVREVGKHNLEPVELICGGFPCQDLSLAGKRAGFDGERSSLWFEFERIINEMRPKWVIIENVPGLLSSRQGRDFGFILNALDERGYGVAWRVLDSKNFGVAQRRRRVFIVGSLGNANCAEVLFESEGLPGDIEKGGKTWKDASTETLRGFGHDSKGRRNDTNALITFDIHQNDDHRKDRPNGGLYVNETDRSLTLQAGQGKSRTVVMASGYRMTAFGEYADDDSASTLKQRDWKDATDLVVWQMDHASDVYREAGDKVPTLQSRMGTGGNSVPLVGMRRLTPTECERLQGFPDGWTASQSDTQRYRQMGNAVTVNVIQWIGRRIKSVEAGGHGGSNA